MMIKNRKWLWALTLTLVFGMAAGAVPADCAVPSSSPTRVPAIELDADANDTLESIKTIEKDFYTIDYTADYALDEILEKGVDGTKGLDNLVSENFADGLPFNFHTVRFACSTFAAATPEGDRIQARNMDFSYANNFLVHTKPKNGYESLSMASGALFGYLSDKNLPDGKLGRLWTLAAPYFPVDGINEKGLSAAILLVQDKVVNQKTGKPPITTTLAVRMMLDKAATVDEAVALMESHDMRSMVNTNFHFHVVDAQGNSAVIEYVDEKISVVRPDASSYGHPVTNFYLTPGMSEVVQDGQDRMEILKKALDANKGVVTKAQAWEMLESIKAVHDFDDVNKIDYMTAYSIIYNNSKRTMDICIDAKFDKVYSFSLEGWDAK